MKKRIIARILQNIKSAEVKSPLIKTAAVHDEPWRSKKQKTACRAAVCERKLIMGTEFANHHIGCTIHNCEHHCCCDDYCSLDKIQVGTHEANPTVVQCTDCLSFKAKPGV